MLIQFDEFEKVVSAARIHRYLDACDGDAYHAMELYRLNLKLSQAMFTVISVFEVALRNGIHRHYVISYGDHWLKEAVQTGGFFDRHATRETRRLIHKALRRLNSSYTPDKLVAEMDFGFWRYLFASPQFRAAGKTLLRMFPAKPKSPP